MSIIKTVSEHDFVVAFDSFNRSDNFTIPARRELFEYYGQLSEDTGEDIELDVIAICCDWSEFTEKELLEEYRHLDTYITDIDELLDLLNDHMIVIPVTWQGVAQNTYLIGEF